MTSTSAVSDIRSAKVQIPNGDLYIQAYLAQPKSTKLAFPVIVFQEIFGVNIHIREVAERLAKAGYVAIAPALYQRTAPNFEVGYTPEAIQQGRSYKEQTTVAELISDIRATIAYFKTLDGVNTDAIGAIGFCFGGHVAYLAATLPEITATASFYGGCIPTSTPGGGEPTLSLTPNIRGTIYGFFGTEDQGIPAVQVDEIEAELTRHQVRHRIFRYPSGHGFFCNHRSSYHPDSATAAWEHVLELFQQTLK